MALCACMGPQNGEPLCPCMMRAARGHLMTGKEPTMSDIPSITRPDERDLYIRMEALRLAKESYSSGFPDNESIIKTAREFETYLRGETSEPKSRAA